MANNQMKTLQVENKSYDFDATWLDGLTADKYALKTEIAAGLHYRGALDGSATSPGAFTPAAETGDVYVVSTAGYINGEYCDNGDLWLCNATCSAATSSNYSTVINSWDIIQGNIKMTDLENRFSEADHTHGVSGNTGNITLTPSGTVSQPTFTGTEAKHEHTVTIPSLSHTFTGDKVELDYEYTPAATPSTGTYQPEGSIGKTSITPSGTVSVAAEAVITGATFTPAVSIGNADGHTHTVQVKHTPSGTVTITKASTGTVNYTPEGTIANDTHKHAVTVSYTPAGTVTVKAGHGSETASATYTPRGTLNSVDDHTHTGSVSISYKPAGTVTVKGAVGTGAEATTITPTGTISGGDHTHTYSSSYTPAGTVSGGKHTHTVTVDLVPENGYDEDTYTLTLAPTATCSEVTPSSYSFSGTAATISGTTASSTPSHTFTGTAINLTGSFSGTDATLSDDFTTSEAGGHSHTYTGTAVNLTGSFSGTQFSSTFDTTEDTHNHTFNGTGAVLAASFSGNEVGTTYTTSTNGGHNHTATGTGIKLSATFSGTAAEHNHTFAGTSKTVSVSGTPQGSFTIQPFIPTGAVAAHAQATYNTSEHTYTPAGTVSKPTFTGTAAEHKHTVSLTTSAANK